jgi:magnesium transporter
MLLMLSATFSSAILTKFESVLPSVLLIFVPMLMGTGGNGGTQVSVTVIRAISVGELKFKDVPRVVMKELFVGILCAISLGVVAFGKVMLVDNLIMQNAEATIFVALAVALAVGLTIMASKLVGCVLPLVAKKLGFDPAVMASPFITTIVDILSLLLYFVVAQALL